MNYRFACILTLFAFSLSYMAHGAPTVFSIDPTQSQVTISAKIAGVSITEQGLGSLATKFGGALNAEITGSTIQFTGGSVIDAEVNGTWEPGVGGSAGSAPADFAGEARSFLGAAKGAFRNIVLDVTSSALPLANGTFDATGLIFGFPAGSTATLDYDLGLTKGSRGLSGLSTNQVTQAGTLTIQGDAQKLVIQVDAEYKFKALLENDSSARLVGQLVAIQQTQSSQPKISQFTFADKKLSLTVEGATANAQPQSSPDLNAWQPRVAERKTEGDKVIFTMEQNGTLEFFRIVQ